MSKSVRESLSIMILGLTILGLRSRPEILRELEKSMKEL